jgi:hypothetical protein
MGAAKPSTGTEPPSPSPKDSDETPEPMDLLEAKGDVV